MKLYSTTTGLILEDGGERRSAPGLALDQVFQNRHPHRLLRKAWRETKPRRGSRLPKLLAPAQSQEIWAAGVTYYRSRSARMEESEAGGGASFYDKVYNADRPELFFKSPAWRAIGPDGPLRIRKDSTWNVPEPELTLAISRHGEIFGYTLGNDMSSRSIEGENPLYLPQAKCYDGSTGLGPCILVATEPLDPATEIRLDIRRARKIVFDESIPLSQIKRGFDELASWLFRETTFPHGALLMTGTGIVPTTDFSLQPNDIVNITCPPIGTLTHRIAKE